MKKMLAVLILLLTSACSILQPQPVPSIPRPLPTQNMVPSPPPEKPRSPKVTDLASSYGHLLDRYAECRETKQGLIDWINRGTN